MPSSLRVSNNAIASTTCLRTAGKELLSLALIDSRNHTLGLLAEFEQALGVGLQVPRLDEINPLLWELGHIGWFAEWWTCRNPHRHLGHHADPTAIRLQSIESRADSWWNSSGVPHQDRWTLDLPDLAGTKQYLLDSLESSLSLLAQALDEDNALYFYRLALFHEDMHGEALIYMAQTLGVPLGLSLPGGVGARAPVLIPAARWQLGSPGNAGFSFDNERGMHEVAVPEFEIDAQAVSWAQFVEFVDDGGYDRAALWQPQGWQWLQKKAASEGRRGPRYVEQIGGSSGAVRQTRFGTVRHMLGSQPVTHVTWWEADAWCRWAGRRLPAEVEWELVAHTAQRSGFRWGDVWEWTGSSFHPYPGFVADPYVDYSEPWFGTHKVLRGASFATHARIKHLKYRNFYRPERDDIFCGFRSCAL